MATSVKPTVETTNCELKSLSESSERVKAALFNLILVCQDSHRLDYFRTVIQAIITKFPCRILFVQLDSAGKDHFDTEASILRVHQGEDTIECDQTIIRAGGKDVERVSFFILPLLVPDLPFMLIWGGDPTHENALLRQLLRYAHRLIFDSESVENLGNFSQHLLQESSFKHLELVDLNWVRSSGWRHVLAKVFDTPDRIRQLTHATDIAITYNSLESCDFHHCSFQATYLQAWLATRLKWKFKKQQDGKFFYDNGVGTLVVSMTPKQVESHSPGSVQTIEVAIGDTHQYSITRRKGFEQVSVHVSSQETCELPFTINLPSSQPSFGFLKEVFYSYSSDHYRDMLHILSSHGHKK